MFLAPFGTLRGDLALFTQPFPPPQVRCNGKRMNNDSKLNPIVFSGSRLPPGAAYDVRFRGQLCPISTDYLRLSMAGLTTAVPFLAGNRRRLCRLT